MLPLYAVEPMVSSSYPDSVANRVEVTAIAALAVMVHASLGPSARRAGRSEAGAVRRAREGARGEAGVREWARVKARTARRECESGRVEVGDRR